MHPGYRNNYTEKNAILSSKWEAWRWTNNRGEETPAYLDAPVVQCSLLVVLRVATLGAAGVDGRVRPGAIDTVKAGKGMTPMVQQVLEERQVLHGEHIDAGEGGGVGGNEGIDVGSMLHQQLHCLAATLSRCHHQGPEEVQVGVGASRQQEAHSRDVIVNHREVEWCGAAVLIQL